MMAVAIMKFHGDSSLFRNCARATATVMLSGLERVATIVINPDFAMLAGIENPEERRLYVERLALAEARLLETLIRDMRVQARAGETEPFVGRKD